MFEIGPGKVFGLLSVCYRTGCAGELAEEIEYQYGMIVGSRDFDPSEWGFQADVAQKISQIPLTETPHEDFRVWKEQSGELSLRSAYKLFKDACLDPNFYLIQADLKDFYNNLWNLQLPSKIAITTWRISWN